MMPGALVFLCVVLVDVLYSIFFHSWRLTTSSFLFFSYTREIGYEHLLCITWDEIQIFDFLLSVLLTHMKQYRKTSRLKSVVVVSLGSTHDAVLLVRQRTG